MTANALSPPPHPSRRSSRLSTAKRSLGRTACVLMLACAAPLVGAQSPDASYDQLDWTGRPETTAIARKEAGAALVEGRRDCARQRNDRAACLKRVQDDYAAMLKRVSTGRTQR